MSKLKLKALPPRVAVLPPRLSEKKGSWKSEGRASRHERGYGAAWERVRKAVLRRDGGLCTYCRRQGFMTAAEQVDHVVPKAEGGTDDESNLASTCVPCHQAKSAEEAKRGRERVHGGRERPRRRTIGPDGWPVE